MGKFFADLMAGDPLTLWLAFFTASGIALGVAIFPHGAQKAAGWFGGAGLEATLADFRRMGIDDWMTYCAVAAEFVGSLALVFGFFGRVAALGIGLVMIVGAYKVHLENGFFMNWTGHLRAGQEGFEYHVLAIGLALAILIKGSGAYSVDKRLAGGGR